MRSTPHISIYTNNDENYSSVLNIFQKACLVFSKHLPYNRRLARTRVTIYLGDEEEIHIIGSIKSVSIKCHPAIFENKTEQQRLYLLLKIIYDALVLIGTSQNWDVQVFENAYQSSFKDQQLVWLTKPLWNKARTLNGRIKIIAEEDTRVSITAEFFDKKEFLYEVHVIDTFLVQADWFNTFSKPLWLDDKTFGFSLQKEQVIIGVNINTKRVTISITEKYSDRESLEGYIKMLHYKKFETKEELVRWMNE